MAGFAGLAAQEEFGGARDLKYPYHSTPNRIPAKDFARNDFISNAKLSPDGTHMIAAFPTGSYTTVRVTAVEPEEAEKHYSFKATGGALENVHWISNDHILIQTRRWKFEPRRGWFPNVALRIIPRNQTYASLVKQFDMKRPEAVVQQVLLHALPDDADHILISASPDEKSTPAVYKLNIQTGDMQEIVARRDTISVWQTDNEGNVRTGYGEEDGELRIVAKTAASSDWQELKNSDLFKTGRFFPTMFDFGNDIMIVRSAAANGRFAFYRFSLKMGKITEKIFEHPTVDVSGIEYSLARKSLLAITYIDHTLKRHFLDEKYKQLFAAIDKSLPKRSNTLLSSSKDDRYMLIKSVSDTYPGAIYRLDTTTKEMEAILEVNPSLEPRLLAPTKPISYFARDGLEIPAYVTSPIVANSGKPPAIILPHNGPLSRDIAVYNRMVQFLASRGYLVLQPNYRGSSGYSFEYQALGYGEWGGVIQEDIEDAVHFLVNEGLADKDKICIVGQSTFSAYSALLGTLKTPELFACGVAISPVPDLRNHVKTIRYWFGKSRARAITGRRSAKAIKAASPMELAEGLKKPLLVFFGGRDWLVAKKEILKLDKKLKKSSMPPVFLANAKEGRGLKIPSVRRSVYEEIETFLAEHLGKPDQSAFVLKHRPNNFAKTTAAAGKARASKLDLTEVLNRCVSAHFMPFVSITNKRMPEVVGYCSSFIEQAPKDTDAQTMLSAYLTRAKLYFLTKNKKAFDKDIVVARTLVEKSGATSLQKASVLALRVLEILEIERLGNPEQALSQAKILSDAEPNYIAGHDLFRDLSYVAKNNEYYLLATRRQLSLSPWRGGMDFYVENLIDLRQYEAAKQTIAGQLLMKRNEKNLGSLLLLYWGAEMRQGNLENAGAFVTLFEGDKADTTNLPVIKFPGQANLTLNQYVGRLQGTRPLAVNVLSALYYFETGQPDKAREYAPKKFDCRFLACWKADQHISKLEDDEDEADMFQYLIDRDNANPRYHYSPNGQWRYNLVRSLPAVPSAVLENGKNLKPNLLRSRSNQGDKITLFFDGQVASDEYSYRLALLGKIKEIAKQNGAEAFAILEEDLGVDIRGSVRGRFRSSDRTRMEVFLVKKQASQGFSPPPAWMVHSVE